MTDDEDSAPCSKRFKKYVKGEECSESWSLTKLVKLNARFTWTKKNFSLCSENVGKKLISPLFSVGNGADKTEWCFHLYPKGFTEECSGWVSLYLEHLFYAHKQFQVIAEFGIVNTMGVDVNIKPFSMSRNVDLKVRHGGISKFVKRDFLFDKENAILSDDELTVFCAIRADVNREDISEIPATPRNRVLEDFAFLLKSTKFSDVTLYVEGKEFQAHKIILAARSPVFRNMFQHDDTEENINNRVKITDIDEEGLSEMLRFMYSGRIHNLKKKAPSLLGIAEKYAMADLKRACEKTLFKNLTIENAVETFILSDKFGAEQLKVDVKKFIVAHASDVGATPEFKVMLQTHPHLGVEAFCASRD